LKKLAQHKRTRLVKKAVAKLTVIVLSEPKEGVAMTVKFIVFREQEN
jgi:hypothetical protein